jgi:hypothetical protein
MPTLFDITVPNGSITLGETRKATAPFTVSNISGRTLRGRVLVSADSPGSAAWFSLVEEAERQYSTGSSQQYTVNIAVPAAVAAGSYTFTLSALDVSNPDDSLVKGPNVTVVVPSVVPVKKPFPWWIVILAVVFIAVVIGIIAAVSSSNQASIAAQTSTAAFNATATQNSGATATVDANATAAQAVIQTAAANLAGTNAANANATSAAQQTNAAATQNAARTATAASLNLTATRNAQNNNATATQKVLSVTQTFVARPTATPIPSARIEVRNNAGLVIGFRVDYTLSSGKTVAQGVGNFPVAQTRSVDIPGDSTNVIVRIVADVTGQSCIKQFPRATNVSISVSGTIFGMNCN